MRKLLLAGLAALTISSCGGQVPSLHLEESLEKSLIFFGNTFHNETILCLKGKIDENRGVIADGFYRPPHTVSNETRSEANVCSPDSNTVVAWHNHVKRSTNENTNKDDCVLSKIDITTIIDKQYDIPIHMVQVRDGYCWWTLEQIKDRRNNAIIQALEGQYWFREVY
jgi:hypothetical protein